MRINYLSDFTVRLQPTVGGEPVDITDHDFRIVFGTSGGMRRYECGKSGDTLTNCTIDGTAIVCVLDNHHLSKGQLCAWVFDYAPDATYPDGNELTVTPSEIDVTLVTGAGDGSDIDAEVAADISAAVHTAQEAAAEAAASADDADDAAVLARAAQVAAEDAAERAAEVGGYSKSEADALLALKADKATTYTKSEADARFAAKGESYTKSEADSRYATPSDIPAQVQSDWSQDDSTAVDFIKHKPNVYTKSEVDTALGGKQDTLVSGTDIKTINNSTLLGSGDLALPTSSDVAAAINLACPLIEDTRSSAVAAITGVAPFATLVDGQKIVLRLAYNTVNDATLNLTLSNGTTTGAIHLYYHRYNGYIDKISGIYGTYLAGQYIEAYYTASSNRWICVSDHDTNTYYSVITDAQIATGTDTNAKSVSAKVLVDNFAKHVKVIDASTEDDPAAITQAIAPNTFYEFGVVDSLTITLTAGESGYLAIYAFAFEANTASTTLTLPATIVGDAPTIAAGKRYELNILDNVLLYTENDGDD